MAIFAGLCSFTIASLHAGAFTEGNLVVELMTGTTSGSTAVNLVEYSTSGTTAQTIGLPNAASRPTANPYNLTDSGSATSNGNLSRSTDGSILVVPGYNGISTDTTSFASSSAATISRTIGVVNASGNVNTSRSYNMLSGNNFRSIASTDGTAFWAAGAPGAVYVNSTGTVSSLSAVNTRTVNIFNNQLYYSTGSGTIGIYALGSGLPTSGIQTATTFIATGTGSSPYGFAINSAGTICYIADDRASASGGGIQKWTYSGGTWALAYTLGTGATTGARGLVVDWSGSNPIIYGTSAEASLNRIFKITDSSSASTASTLATAGTGTVFRGLAFAPKYSLPTISGLSPSSAVPGGSEFPLVINGSNFYAATQVTLAGVSKTVTYVNSGQLTIPVTAAEIASVGSLEVVVTNPPPGGGSARTTLAVIGGPSLSLGPPFDNSTFASTIQTPTASRQFTVSGMNLTTGITVTVPFGFEISSNENGPFSSAPLVLPPTGSQVPTTTLYLRFNPAAVQSYSGNLTVATEGLSPSPSFAVMGNSAAPNEGKLTGTFADGSATLNATAPATGTVTEYIVLAKVGSAITDVPTGDGSAYNASTTYGLGTKIGDSCVVYKGSTPPSAYQVTGLTNRLRYYFSMYSRVATAYSTGNSTNGFPYSVLGNVITQWDYNNNPPTATLPSPPSIGAGSSSYAGTITSATTGQGSGSTDSGSPNNAASTTGYPASTVDSGTSGVVFSVSTTGKQNIVVYWDVRHSNTASRYTQFQYTTDGGTTWNNYSATGDLTDSGYYVANTGDTWFLQRKADLSGIPAVNNNANFAFRIVTVFAPGTSAYAAAQTAYGTTGTLRYDMVTVTGTAVSTQTPYDSWATGYGLSEASAAGTADPDNDGMDNNAEFAFGTSPIAAGSRAATLTTSTGSIKLTWLQRSGVTYAVKSFTDLTTAFDSGTAVTPSQSTDQSNKPSADYMRYEATLNADGTRGFLKVRATQ